MKYTDPETPSGVVQDIRDSGHVFIHSELDDAELTAAEFRVYAHLARRAGKDGAYPGIDSMCEKCRLSKPTVIAAIKELETRQMLRVSRTIGQSSRYILTRRSEWTTSKNEVTPTSKNEVTHQSKVGNATSKNEVTKGNPSEGNPIKGNGKSEGKRKISTIETEIPATLKAVPEFETQWEKFSTHRRQMKKPLTPLSAEGILEDLAKRPQDTIAALKMAIRRSWQGFEWSWYDAEQEKPKNGTHRPDHTAKPGEDW